MTVVTTAFCLGEERFSTSVLQTVTRYNDALTFSQFLADACDLWVCGTDEIWPWHVDGESEEFSGPGRVTEDLHSNVATLVQSSYRFWFCAYSSETVCDGTNAVFLTKRAAGLRFAGGRNVGLDEQAPRMRCPLHHDTACHSQPENCHPERDLEIDSNADAKLLENRTRPGCHATLPLVRCSFLVGASEIVRIKLRRRGVDWSTKPSCRNLAQTQGPPGDQQHRRKGALIVCV